MSNSENQIVAQISAAKWASAFDLLKSPCALLDYSGKLLLANQAFLENLKGTPAWLVASNSFFDLLAAQSSPLLKDELKSLSGLNQAQARTLSLNFQHITDSALNFRLTNIPQADFCLIELDNASPNPLELTELLRRSREEVNEFAYIVSHDLKAPLRSVTSLANWIQEDHAESLNAEGKEQLALLQQAVRQLTRLFDGVLEYSRAGRLTSAPTHNDSKQILEDLIQEYPASISWNYAELAPLFGESSKIVKLLSELVKNAVAAVPQETGIITIASQLDSGFVHFTVCDNGTGLDPKFHKSVFQIFRRGPAGSSEEHLGLGLSLAKRIVEAHAGEIWIESADSSGTAVHFKIPDRSI